MVNIHCRNDIVCIEQLSPGKVNLQSKVLLPDMIESKSNFGIVVAVGPGKLGPDGKRLPLSLQVGDTVVVYGQAGFGIELEGRKLYFFEENAVPCVLKRSDDDRTSAQADVPVNVLYRE